MIRVSYPSLNLSQEFAQTTIIDRNAVYAIRQHLYKIVKAKHILWRCDPDNTFENVQYLKSCSLKKIPFHSFLYLAIYCLHYQNFKVNIQFS